MQQGLTYPFDNGVSVSPSSSNNRLTLAIRMKTGADCVLHWGLSRQAGGPWVRPPDACLPQGSTPVDGPAVRTPFAPKGQNEREVLLHFDQPFPAKRLAFVIHLPGENRWLKNGGQDYSIPLRNGQAVAPEQALTTWVPEASFRQTIPLDLGTQLAVARQTTPEGIRVWLVSNVDAPLLLHWGLAWQFQQQWQAPPESFWPTGTTAFDPQAVRTPFQEREGLRYLELNFPAPAKKDEESATQGPRGLCFLLYQPEENVWLKDKGKDLFVSLFEPEVDSRLPASLGTLAEKIVSVEKGSSSWTLMHRFNLGHDLLDQAHDEDALALLFAWLRFSAIRQLDWQRNYNTKPRELSASQDRLTRRLARLWREQGGKPHSSGDLGVRPWVRLLLTTLGRGGEGQQVRDEILHIMHRHNIKEVSGHFLEEWHQKLHNNTTPDDVVICSAYLAFLQSKGDLDRFNKTLEDGGVTRERLLSFERPIKSDPTFEADKAEALRHDFENFLRILKSVHSGTDLESAVGAARGSLGEQLGKKLDGLVASLQKPEGHQELAPAVMSARDDLQKVLAQAADEGVLRDQLFLDLALEASLRSLIEQQNLSQLDRDALVEQVELALRNLHRSVASQELAVCQGHWKALLGVPREGRDWALHAKSVADRIARWVRSYSDELYQRLQPKAESLGQALEVEDWTVPLFSEEVIRGGPAFVLSLLLRPLDRLLRQEAGLGGWQVISPAAATGRLRLVERLVTVQGERFPEATVLIADTVAGNEEIPEGVTAVLTADSPDLVSHVSVRARNAHVLFASCFEPEVYEQLKQLKDQSLALRVTPGGDVEWSETNGATESEPANGKAARRAQVRPTSKPCPHWVLTQEQFTPDWVGGKSNNLNGLRGKLADWIHLPTSLALPFGACERVLAEANAEQRREYESLVAEVEKDPERVLPRLRELHLQLAPPAALQQALRQAWGQAGLPAVPWEKTWTAIRRVWASKWNDRACFSRRAQGIPHDSLQMAVLIQQVVPADYAFVIHTHNPINGNAGEIFAEVVLGMGETLVGNDPGRALGFVCRKEDQQLEILSYPGKSRGTYGKGVIFRSDSNGEDLEGFAGAGLYDSFLAEEPEDRVLDYQKEKLVWDPKFRDELLRSIARIGLEVERVLGSAQDIEGAVAGGQFYVVQTRPQVGE